ncbi:uncharacterized protein LOC127842151 [Dreissena polymorpha]|uniref:TNFR-Cys domain-containing protein n=1 Tax=Dreissena polymorpha TaxID=45954 RepID=A0A9D4N400_DREPO|nr:uncharacterized protein LOC127842151 [Dreissena polymorpha]XP_052227470.1 uncharacterized protein LOC127842151 [Dreissena polymorpha]KAH3886302.1 hypothetical protein DPMN_010306 [Dreissena polymorpha]
MPSVVVFLVVAVILCGAAASTPSCPSMHFFVQEEGCRKCSECSEGQVMLRPCYGDRDTTCGLFPWSEFKGKPVTSDESSTPTPKTPSNDETLVWPEKTEGDRWFTITMVLVVILVIAMVGGIVALLVLCYVCRQRKLRAITEESACVEEPLTKQISCEQFTLVRET